MNDHIGKPFDIQKLIPLIKRYTELVNVTELIHSAVEMQQWVEPEQVTTDLIEPIANILARFSNNRELAARMCKRFGTEVKGLIEKMEAAIQAENQSDLTAVFHSIKGVAATLGAVRLAKVSSALEAQGRQGHVTSEESIASLHSLMAQSVIAVEQLNFDTETKVEITLAPEQLRDLLEQIGAYLAENNMSAMTLAEKLVASYGRNTDVKIFYAQVESLDFHAAQGTLKIVKEVLLNGSSKGSS